MVSLSSVMLSFVKGIQKSKVSLLGAFITTVTFPVLVGAILLDMLGYVTNAYYGFFIYMILGPTFIFGLVLVFVGVFFFKEKTTQEVVKAAQTSNDSLVRAHSPISTISPRNRGSTSPPTSPPRQSSRQIPPQSSPRRNSQSSFRTDTS